MGEEGEEGGVEGGGGEEGEAFIRKPRVVAPTSFLPINDPSENIFNETFLLFLLLLLLSLVLCGVVWSPLGCSSTIT